MPALMGLDPEELLALAAHFQIAAGELGVLGAQLRTRMAHTSWRGPDADRCMSEFGTTHAAALNPNAPIGIGGSSVRLWRRSWRGLGA